MDSEKTKETTGKGADVAFPMQFETDNLKLFGTGMTLLDYFAAKAMYTSCDHGVGYEERTAQCAYRLATAMIKEREKHLK